MVRYCFLWADLACLSTPMGERGIDEIVEATNCAAARLGRVSVPLDTPAGRA